MVMMVKSPKNAFIAVEKTTKITSHDSIGVKFDAMVAASLQV